MWPRYSTLKTHDTSFEFKIRFAFVHVHFKFTIFTLTLFCADSLIECDKVFVNWAPNRSMINILEN